jgi:hypothetical protein
MIEILSASVCMVNWQGREGTVAANVVHRQSKTKPEPTTHRVYKKRAEEPNII